MSLHVLLFTLHFIFIAIAFVEITRYRNSDIRFFRPQLPLNCSHLEFLPDVGIERVFSLIPVKMANAF